jgi:TPR repeat protein
MTTKRFHRLVAIGITLVIALQSLAPSVRAMQTMDDWTTYFTSARVEADHKAAAAGDTAAMVRLGWRYVVRTRGGYSGKRNPADAVHRTGVTQNDAEAVRWFRKAAEAGDARAMANLGFMYESGKGVAQDFAEATRWYRKGADAGDNRAKRNLGVMYLLGAGITRNDAEAAKWFRDASKTTHNSDGTIRQEGDFRAQTNLALLYLSGRGVPKDDAEAVYLLTYARDPLANYVLGTLRATGTAGLKKELRQAIGDFNVIAGTHDRYDEIGTNLWELGDGLPASVVKAAREQDEYLRRLNSATRLTPNQIIIGISVLAIIAAGVLGVSPGSSLPGTQKDPICKVMPWLNQNEEAFVRGLGAQCD